MNLNLRNTGGVRVRPKRTPEENARLNRQGTRLLILYAVFIVSLVALMWNLERVKHVLTGSVDRSSLITGTWVGRVQHSDRAPDDDWAMPPDGAGTWAILIQTRHGFLSSFDSVKGTIQTCSEGGVRSSSEIAASDLVHGTVNLDVLHHAPGASPIQFLAAYARPQDGRLLFTARLGNSEDLRGILHRAEASEFDQICK